MFICPRHERNRTNEDLVDRISQNSRSVTKFSVIPTTPLQDDVIHALLNNSRIREFSVNIYFYRGTNKDPKVLLGALEDWISANENLVKLTIWCRETALTKRKNPIDVNPNHPPPFLKSLLEKLARNVHRLKSLQHLSIEIPETIRYDSVAKDACTLIEKLPQLSSVALWYVTNVNPQLDPNATKNLGMLMKAIAERETCFDSIEVAGYMRLATMEYRLHTKSSRRLRFKLLGTRHEQECDDGDVVKLMIDTMISDAAGRRDSQQHPIQEFHLSLGQGERPRLKRLAQELPNMIPNVSYLVLQVTSTTPETRTAFAAAFQSMSHLKELRICDNSASLCWGWLAPLSELVQSGSLVSLKIAIIDPPHEDGVRMIDGSNEVDGTDDEDSLDNTDNVNLVLTPESQLVRTFRGSSLKVLWLDVWGVKFTNWTADMVLAMAKAIPTMRQLSDLKLLFSIKYLVFKDVLTRADHKKSLLARKEGDRATELYRAQDSLVCAIKSNGTIKSCEIKTLSPWQKDDVSLTMKLRQTNVNSTTLSNTGSTAALPLSVLPLALSTLSEGFWYDVVFHIIRENPDVTKFAAKSPQPKAWFASVIDWLAM